MHKSKSPMPIERPDPLASRPSEGAFKASPLRHPKFVAPPRASAARRKAGLPKAVSSAEKSSRPPSVAAIIGELVSILPELDAEGLAFLLDQARLRRYALAAERRVLEEAKDARGSRRLGAEVGRSLRMDRSSDGSTYHIVAGGTWKMFTAEETAAMVRISRLDLAEAEAARRLHAWLGEERRDFLVDLDIEAVDSPKLRELLALLRETFPAKSPRSSRR